MIPDTVKELRGSTNIVDEFPGGNKNFSLER